MCHMDSKTWCQFCKVEKKYVSDHNESPEHVFNMIEEMKHLYREKCIYEDAEVVYKKCSKNFNGYLAGSDWSILYEHPKKGLIRPKITVNKVSGYQSVNHSKFSYMHDLVCDAFYGLKPSKMNVDHIDGNRSTNNPKILRYCTVSENILNRVPTKKPLFGVYHDNGWVSFYQGKKKRFNNVCDALEHRHQHAENLWNKFVYDVLSVVEDDDDNLNLVVNKVKLNI